MEEHFESWLGIQIMNWTKIRSQSHRRKGQQNIMPLEKGTRSTKKRKSDQGESKVNLK